MGSLVSTRIQAEQYGRVESSCSPRLVKFVNGITSERFPGWKDFTYADGSAVYINSSLRSFREQVEEYKKGRNISWSMIPLTNKVLGNVSAFALDLDTIKKSSGWTTNAFAGQSYHNFGLAVDVVFRKYGWNTPGGYKFYIDSGLVAWAKECGLEWGGDWRNTGSWGANGDMVHFQDPNYSIPVNFTDKYTYDNTLKRSFSYNPNWVRGNDNFKWVCSYNGLSYAEELKKIKKEGGSSDGLKPDTSDVIKTELKSRLGLWALLCAGLFALFGKKK